MNLAKDIICNTKTIASEYLELGIDTLIQDDIIKNIPVVDTAISIFKVGSSIQQAFLQKINLFFIQYG